MTAPATPRLWKVVAASEVGTSHLARDLPCQDAHNVAAQGGLLVIAVADGAGSAPRSDEGARAAVEAAVSYVLLCAGLLDDLDERADLGDPDGDDGDDEMTLADLVQEAVLFARDAVVDLAGDDDPRALATTLTVLVADADAIAVAQVGDGAVVLRRSDDFELVGPVERSEFLNETVFLTSTGWEDELRVDVVEVARAGAAPVDAVAAMTDGLQLLALDLAAGRPHAGFFVPLFDWAAGARAGQDELAAFLGSERVCARTDDDKTLVLATVTTEAAVTTPEVTAATTAAGPDAAVGAGPS